MIRRSAYAAVLAVACNVCLLTSSVVAWNSSGHMIVALTAYDNMDDASKTKAIELLRAHPRFHDHFERFMPREVSSGSDAETNEWLFAHGATWPDLVRSASGRVSRKDVNDYSRPWWHFINEPIFLDDGQRRELEPLLDVNINREPPDYDDERFMNVVQAVKNSSRLVKDTSEQKEKRSVHLCWLLHLVGDSHQPMHASALYTTHRFRQGDHGGNFLDIHPNYDLHGFWDDQICTEKPYETLRILAAEVGKNPELTAAGVSAAATLDVGDWIDESHELAKKYAYSPEVLKKVAAREKHTHLGDLQVPPSYEANAESVSERRAVEAGHRLAGLLEGLLP